MRDLRNLLDEAAGSPPDLPDLDGIRRRAHPRIIRRRVASIVCLAAVLMACWIGVSTLAGGAGKDRGDVVTPAPPPSMTEDPSIRQGQLEPGAYRGRVGDRRLRLEVDNDDWSVVAVHPTWVALTFRQYVLHLQVWGSVVPPRSTDADGHQDVPDDVATWLVGHPRLSTSPPTAVVAGGSAATQLDVRVVRPLQNPPAECTGPCVVLGRIASEGEPVDITVGERARFLVFGQGRHQLIVHYRAPERQFAALDGAVQDLLTGVRIAPD